MSKHKRILGIVFLLFGVLVSVAVGSVLRANPLGELTSAQQIGILSTLFFGVAFVAAGYALLVGLRWASKLCLPISVFVLFAFPVGTAIGGYYLWYYYKFRRVGDT